MPGPSAAPAGSPAAQIHKFKFWIVWHPEDGRGVLYAADTSKTTRVNGGGTSFEFRTKAAGRELVRVHVAPNDRVKAGKLLNEIRNRRWLP